MKTTELHQEFIKDNFSDYVDIASEILGCECCDTEIQGSSAKGENKETKYQIMPDPFSAKTPQAQINLEAFESYFSKNFGKWNNSPTYFDTPAEAFAQLLKAWYIWNYQLEKDVKQQYLSQAENTSTSLT